MGTIVFNVKCRIGSFERMVGREYIRKIHTLDIFTSCSTIIDCEHTRWRATVRYGVSRYE